MEPYISKPERLGYFVEQKGKVEQSYLKSLVGFTDKPVILYLQRSLPLCVTSILTPLTAFKSCKFRKQHQRIFM